MLVFTDIESTSLDERAGHLLEVALVLTDDDLCEVAATSTLVQPVGVTVDQLIALVDPVVREMHEKNGLWDELRQPGAPRRYEAEALLVEWVRAQFAAVPAVKSERCDRCKKESKDHSRDDDVDFGELQKCADGGMSGWRMLSALSQTPLAGSTVSFDRRWLRAHLPTVEALFHYRSVDVSSVGELARRWAPEVYANRPRSTDGHRALADARGSIAVLRHYRDRGFVRPSTYLTAEQIAPLASRQ